MAGPIPNFTPGNSSSESLGEEVGRRVPESVLAFGIFPFEQLDCGVVIDGTADIPFLIIDFGCQYILGQTRAYALGDLKGVVPASYCFTEPSGKVILII